LLNSALEALTHQYPKAAASKGGPEGLRESVGPLFSKEVIELPKSVYAQVEKAVRDLYHYGKSTEYKDWLIADYNSKGDSDAVAILNSTAKNHSILMAYDFHYEPKSQALSLIEINTNASGFLFADIIYKTQRLAFQSDQPEPTELFLKSIATEMHICGLAKPKKIAIIDENPESQKMYLEFLMYHDLLTQKGYPVEIFDYRNVPLTGEVDFIYNRHTDFTFSQPASARLRQAYLDDKLCFSPHPKEYLLLAHKERLIHFAEKNLSDTLIPTFILDEKTDQAELWARRKNLFFKPRALFGAKATYKGSSISHKVFDKLFLDESVTYLAQEFRPAGEQNGFKYDFRFYVYEDQIHLGVARVYQGQVTNFNTPGGGFAPIKLI
jgi:hypothetical protein